MMEITQTLSFGIFMLIESLIILGLLLDLIRRTARKMRSVAHRHLDWNAGKIFMAYLLCVFAFNVSETYTVWVNYISGNQTIEIATVVSRVFSRTLILMAKALLWYYTIKGGFYLFRTK